jgi:hypothetical protein
MDSFTTTEIIKMLIPYIAFEVLLKAFCLFKLTRDEVKLLPKYGWALIIIFITTIGSLVYLTIGRKKY